MRATRFGPGVGLLPRVQTGQNSRPGDGVRRDDVVIGVSRAPVCAGFRAIGRRRDPNQFSEYGSEITLVTEPHFLADVRYRFFGHQQQRLGAFDAAVIQVRHEGLPCGAFEETHEVRFAHSADARGFLHLNGLAKMAFQVLEQRSQSFERALLPLEGLHCPSI